MPDRCGGGRGRWGIRRREHALPHPSHHARRPPRRAPHRRRAEAVGAGRVRRPGEGQGVAPDRHRRRQAAPGTARSHPVLRAPGPRQDDARAAHGEGARRERAHHVGPGAGAPGRPGRPAHVAPAERHLVHRRSAPPAPGARGVPLPRHGGLPGGRAHRRRPARADHSHGARAVHADRRHDPLRAAHAAHARALRAGGAPVLLSARRPGADHRALGRHPRRSRGRRGHRRDRPPQSWHAARGQPAPEARARLCPGARRRQDHGAGRGRGTATTGCGRVRPRRHGRADPQDDHRAVRRRPGGTHHHRRRRRGGRRDARGSVRAVPDAAGIPGPHPARPLRHGGHVQALRLYAPTERGTADDVRQLNAERETRNAEQLTDLLFRVPTSAFRVSPMRTSDFDYDLPPSLIAQDPLPDRGGGRLLVLDRAGGAVRHGRFVDGVDLVAPEDVLVVNVSRVIPARLHGKRETGKTAELLLVRELPDGSWIAMGHPGGKLKPGRRVTFGDDSAVEIVDVLGGGLRRIRFAGALDARATLAKYGEVPLPPYIRRAPDAADSERYQTVYAAHDGSVAAPTAGLHFTPELLADIYTRQVRVASIDLHVGPGTFKPVETEDLSRHPMHAEAYAITPGAAEWINHATDKKRGVWAVGTTVVRALESSVDPDGLIRAGAGETNLFIRPPYDFRVVSHLITNFHL